MGKCCSSHEERTARRRVLSHCRRNYLKSIKRRPAFNAPGPKFVSKQSNHSFDVKGSSFQTPSRERRAYAPLISDGCMIKDDFCQNASDESPPSNVHFASNLHGNDRHQVLFQANNSLSRRKHAEHERCSTFTEQTSSHLAYKFPPFAYPNPTSRAIPEENILQA
jgi:hypothetical protein